MRTFLRRSLVVVAAAALSLTGCGPAAAPPPAGPPRVVTLAPNLTEIVCAIGADDLLVGRTSACKYPPNAVTNIPIVGGFGTPALEMLLKVRASLVLEVDLEDKTMGRKIDRLGIPRRRIVCKKLDDIPRAIETVGQLLGREPAASELANRFASRLGALRASAAAETHRPAVFVEIWGDPIMTVGRNNFISELIALAGGRSIGDEVTDKDYFAVSSEWVVARDPEVIVCLTMLGATEAGDAVKKRAGWDRIRAVRSGRVHVSAYSDTLTLPGPRCLDGLDELRGFIGGSPAGP